MIAAASTPAGQRAVHATALDRQPRGAERVGDRRRRVAHQQRPLERDREILDHPPRLELSVVAGAGE